MSDPRLGLPSASAMWRIENCPASHQLCKGLPDVSNEDASSGTRIHKALETGDVTGLNDSEVETFEMCERQTAKLLDEWGKQGVTFYREMRLGLLDNGHVIEVKGPAPQGLNFLFTGQGDLVGVSRDNIGVSVILIDFKSGRGSYENAVENAQLRSLAALVGVYFQAVEVRVAIVQPWMGPATVADFSKEGINRAYQWVFHTIDQETHASPNDTNPGAWCNWCKAKAICNKWQAQAKRVENTQLVPSDSILARSMLPEDVAAFDDLCSRVMQQAAKGRAWVQGLVLQDPAKFAAFYSTEQTTGRETISKLDEVWNRFSAAGVAQKDFLACLTARKADSASTGLPGFKGVLKRSLGLKGKAVDDKLNEILDGCTVEGKTKTVAVRLGATLEEGE